MTKRTLLAIILLLAGTLLLAACGDVNQPIGGSPAAPATGVPPTAVPALPTAVPPTSVPANTPTKTAPTAVPPKIPAAKVPAGFCENKDGMVANDLNRWPDTDPCAGKKGSYVIVAKTCQVAPGLYAPDTKGYNVYAEATKACSTGVMWFEPITMSAVPTKTTGTTTAVAQGTCANESTREARLDCATKEYFANGEKLAGFAAYMRSLGATWDELQVGDPFQPSADPLPNGSPRIWGGVLKATNLKVTGNSCLVTDVPSRIASAKWAFLDARYNPKPSVGHYGETVSSGKLTEIAFNGDCSDWIEIRDAATKAGYTLR